MKNVELQKEKDRYYARKASPEGCLRLRYKSMRIRSIRYNRSLCSREDFIQFGLMDEEFLRLHKDWVSSGYDIKISPSVDRIDNDGGYTLDNIQFITASDNSRKAHVDLDLNKTLKSKTTILEKDGEILEFSSAVEAAKYIGSARTAVITAINNNHRIYGYTPYYKE